MLPCLYRVTREAVGFKQGVGSRRAGVGAEQLCMISPREQEDRQRNFMRTGRMAEGWGRGGGWVSQGWPQAYIMLKKQRVRSSSSWAWIGGNHQDDPQNH